MHRVTVFYSAPGRGTGYCFHAISFCPCLFISLFLCQQHYEKTAGPICMKFSEKVCSDHGTTWFNFGSIRVNGSAGRRSIFVITGHSSESVAFARWQQGAGFVAPRTPACFKYFANVNILEKVVNEYYLNIHIPTSPFKYFQLSNTDSSLLSYFGCCYTF